MECTRCQTIAPEGARFCMSCGNPLTPACPQCGTELPPEARFCLNCGHQLAQTPPPAESPAVGGGLEQYIPKELLTKLEAARSSGGIQGERRVVTMLFCDVTGSTAAAENLDPEEWAQIMNGAFEHLIAPVYRYEGTLARLMGDAILAFFGAPIAHEDDPQRAVLAGLSIVHGIRDYQEKVKSRWDLDFGVRVGINTGLVVAGEVGSDLRVEYTAMGDAINLAARMEQTAHTGTVRISADTYSLIAPLFDFEGPEEIEVKGKSEPVPAYRVIGSKAVPGSLRGIEGLKVPLVGRDGEIRALRQVLADLHRGSGGIVCLIGEAGIGKTSLIDELHAEWKTIAGVEAPWIESRGVSYDTTRPYGLFMQRMFQVLGVEDNDSLETVRAKIAVAPVGFAPQVQMAIIRAVEALLAFESDAGGPQVQGEALQAEVYEACHSMWRAAASLAPTVLVIDDLQWSDPASVDLITDMFSLVDDVALLLLCSFRPERQSAAWRLKQAAEANFPHRYTEVSLGALSDKDSDALFGNLLNTAEPPPRMRQLILGKTEGNPLFVEEFLRTLIDTGAITQDDSGLHWREGTKVEDIPIPENLQALLTARIDRLEDDARRILQLSSVIGRSFHHGVLKIISDSNAALDRHLSTLQRAELIREAQRIPELEYIFRHDLTRDAAYNSILLRERREYHRRVGEAVEELFSERLEEHSHRLAHHFYQAEDYQRALRYSVMAGDAAARLYANDEAVTHYTRAIEIARQDDSPSQRIMALYMSRGRVQEVAGLCDHALAGYEELEELGRAGLGAEIEMAALIAMATIHSTINGRPDPGKARLLSDRSLVLARQLNDHFSQARVLWNQMLIEILAGVDYHKALEFGEQSLRIARQYRLEEQVAYTLQDMARAHLAVGQFGEAREALAGAREYWRAVGNGPMLADNLINAAGVFFAAGLFDDGLECVNEALDVSRSIGSVHLEAAALAAAAQANIETGDIDKALEDLQEGISKSDAANGIMSALLHATRAAVLGLYGAAGKGREEALVAIGLGTELQIPYFRITLALAHLNGGRLGEAADALQSLYEGLRLKSKRNTEYLGMISALPDVIRSELALADQDYERVLAFAMEADEQVAEGRQGILLPDILRIKGQALLALGRVGEAGKTLAQAQTIAEARSSKRALWPILFEMSRAASLEGDHGKSEHLLEESKETVNHILSHCGDGDIRNGFLNLPMVRKILGTEAAAS